MTGVVCFAAPKFSKLVQRLLRDLDHEKQTAVQQARIQAWRQ